MFRKQHLMIALVLAVCLPGIVSATVLTYQEGGGGAFSETDAARFANRTTTGSLTAFGSDPLLNTDTSIVGIPDQYFMIGFFDLFGTGSGQIALGTTISSASLTFTSAGNPSAGDQSVHRVLRTWDEDTVTNANFFGGTSSPQAGTDYDATAVTTFVPGFGSTVVVDITSALQDWSNGADNFGLLFFNSDTNAGQATDGWQVHSDNATSISFRPQLTVEFTDVPEPGVVSLFALGLVGLGFRKRTSQA